MRSILYLFLSLLTISLTAQSTNLYPFFEKGHWGFIYEDGTPAIRPQFHSVGAFNQGLAPARPGGLYGYIDESGDFFLEPRFEYAEPFEGGVAKVYLEAGHPVLIDRTGKVLFEHSYQELERRAEPNRLLVITASGQQGLVDYRGRVVIDTFYREISERVNGHYLVYPAEESYTKTGGLDSYRRSVGLMDENGQMVISPNQYVEMIPFGPGYWLVYPFRSREMPESPPCLVLDNQGKERLTWSKLWSRTYEREGFNENGLAPINVYHYDPDTIQDRSLYLRLAYSTVINDQGEQLFLDKGYDQILSFADKRFFVKDTSRKWWMINPLGEIIHEQPFREIHYSSSGDSPWFVGETFEETYWAFHPQEGAFQLPDISAEYGGYWRMIDDWAYFSTEVYQRKTDTYQHQVRALALAGEREWSPPIQAIQENTVGNDGLLTVVLANGNSAYLNKDFSIVYESRPTKTPSALNIDYQMRAYCYASQKASDPRSGLGGDGQSENVYQPLPPALDHQRAVKLEVIREPDLTFRTTARGIRLRMVNQLADTLAFPAQDSRIELVIQAQDKMGAWRDIEYLPSSWCGNSYHQVILPPNNYWNFVIPQYSGAMKTQLRAKVNYYLGEEAQVVYSDPYQASVNPGQFWRRPTYYARGLMDPYDN